MPLALNLVYVATLLIYSPLLLYRWATTRKYREGWDEKFWGNAPVRIGNQPCLWFHAVSVGEVLLLGPLIREMSRRRPGWDIVVSTTTSTGLAVARRAPTSRPRHLLCSARFQLVDAAGRRADPADRPGPGRARALAQPDPHGQAGGRQGGHRQRATERPQLSRISTVAGPAAIDARADRRRLRPE